MLIQEKVNQAKMIVKEFGMDCWLTFVRESALNGDPSLAFLVDSDVTWHSAFIVTSDGRTFAIVGLYDKKTVEDLHAYDEVIGYVQGMKEPFLALMKNINPRTIAVNYSMGSEICDGLTHGMYLTLRDHLYEIDFQDRLVSAEKIVSALRQRKTPTELRYMKEAIRRTEEIFHAVSVFIRPGMTEREIADFMKNELAAAHLECAWEPKSCPAVFTGPDTAGAHYAPTGRKVEQGHILNMDFGVKFNEYCSDLQRTFYVLKEGEDAAPPDVQKGFDTIVHAIEASRQAIKPGVLGEHVDKIARDLVLSGGYQDFPHALGHQVGRFAHDGTALLGPAWEKYAQKPFMAIEEGMVFTLEPRLSVPERGVATVEEMVVVTATSAEYLSTPQQKLFLVRPH
jgi:Xaa-Pro aminopeptidase